MWGLSTSKHFNPVPLALLCKNLLSVLVVVLFVPHALAKQTEAVPAFVDPYGALVESVATDAGLLRSLGSPHVLGVGYGFQVIRANTPAISAKVIDFGAFWNLSVSESIGNSVRMLLLSPVDVSVTVSLGGYETGPVPTVVGFIYPAPKQFGGGSGRAFALTEARLAAVTGKRTFRPERLSAVDANYVWQYSRASCWHLSSYKLRAESSEGYTGVTS